MDGIEQKLKYLRQLNNFTQKDIAQKLGLSQTGYASLEQGLAEPNLTYIKKLCSIYGISSDYLLGLENEDGTKVYAQDYNAPLPPSRSGVITSKQTTIRYAARGAGAVDKHITEEQAQIIADELARLDAENKKNKI